MKLHVIGHGAIENSVSGCQMGYLSFVCRKKVNSTKKLDFI